MWLCDLEKAVKILREVAPTYLFEKIIAGGGESTIIFYTTHHSKVFVMDCGLVCEKYENGEIKKLNEIS